MGLLVLPGRDVADALVLAFTHSHAGKAMARLPAADGLRGGEVVLPSRPDAVGRFTGPEDGHGVSITTAKWI